MSYLDILAGNKTTTGAAESGSSGNSGGSALKKLAGTNSGTVKSGTNNAYSELLKTAASREKRSLTQGLGYLLKKLTSGAISGQKSIINDVSYKAQGDVYTQLAENDYAKYIGGDKTARAEAKEIYKKYLASIPTNMMDAMVMSGQVLDEGSVYLQAKINKYKKKHENDTLVKASTMGENYADKIEKENENLSTGWKNAGSIFESIGQQIPIQAANLIPVVGQAISAAGFYSSASGSEIEEATSAGASKDKALAYGTAIGGIEAATEKISEVIGYGMKLAKVTKAASMDNITEVLIGAITKTPKLQTALRIIGQMNGEGVEEVISDLVSPFARSIYNDKSGAENWKEDVTLQQLWQDYLAGAISGGIMGGVGGALKGAFKAQNQILADQTVQRSISEYKEEKGKAKGTKLIEAAETLAETTEKKQTEAAAETERDQRLRAMAKEVAKAQGVSWQSVYGMMKAAESDSMTEAEIDALTEEEATETKTAAETAAKEEEYQALRERAIQGDTEAIMETAAMAEEARAQALSQEGDIRNGQVDSTGTQRMAARGTGGQAEGGYGRLGSREERGRQVQDIRAGTEDLQQQSTRSLIREGTDTKAVRVIPEARYDAGNVIPLSERFNPEKADIRFSRSETDTAVETTEAEKRVADTVAVARSEGRATMEWNGRSYDLFLGENRGKVEAWIMSDGEAMSEQTEDMDAAARWAEKTLYNAVQDSMSERVELSDNVEGRTMSKEEATALAEKERYPMLEDADGTEHKAVPQYTWVRDRNRGNYGLIQQVNQDGTLQVRFENKSNGKAVTVKKGPMEVEWVSGEYQDTNAEEKADREAPDDREVVEPTQEELELAEQMLNEAEELTEPEPPSPPKQKRNYGEEMTRRLLGEAQRRTDITPEMAREIENATIEGVLHQDPVRASAETQKEETSARVTPDPVSKKKERRKAWNSFKRLMVNTADTIQDIAKKTGNKSLDGYYFYALSAKQRGADWIQKKRTNARGETIGKSLNEILDPIRKAGDEYYKDFQRFLYHRLNIERMSRDRGKERAEAQLKVNEMAHKMPTLATMSNEKLRQMAQQYHSGNYDTEQEGLLMASTDYWEAKKNLERLENKTNKPVFNDEVTADVSKQVVEELEKKHTEFAELADEVYGYCQALLQYRVDSGLITEEDAEALRNHYKHYVPVAVNVDYAKGIQGGGIEVSTTIKKAKGNHGAQLLPLHTAMARQTMSVMRNGGIQRLANALVNEYKAHEAAMAEEILNIRESQEVWDEELADNEVKERGENVITYLQDGKRYDIVLGEGLTAAFNSLKPNAGNIKGLGWLEKGVSTFKKLTTSWHPVFMVTNPLRDVPDALLYSSDAKRWVKNYPMAYKDMAEGGKYWEMYQAMGGIYGSFFNYATGEFDDGKAPKTKAGEKFKATVDKVGVLNMYVEQAPRLAEFMTVLQNKDENGNWSEADLMEAFEAAQDITVNFARSGSFGKIINKYLVPFWNPGVQGLDKAVRSITETKGFAAWASMILKATALGIVPAIINGLIYRDDDEWDDIEDTVKANYFLWKTKDGYWVKIPKGRVVGAISAMAVGVQEGIRGDEVNAGELAKGAIGNIAPANPMETSIFSQLFNSGIFNKENPGKNWYGGKIESERLQGYAPGQRYDESTDYISKWIGGKLNISPKKLNYLLDQYSGVIGDIVLPYLTPKAERSLANISLSHAFVARFSLDTVSNNKISGDYYDMKDELEQEKNELNTASGLAYRFLTSGGASITQLYANVRKIENDTELSDKDKTTLTRELRKEITAKQKEMMETADKYKTAAGEYLKQHPEMDYNNGEAVEEWMNDYNAKTDNKIDVDKAKSKMADIVYRELNREVLGAEYALQKEGNDIYAKATELKEDYGITYDEYYDWRYETKVAEYVTKNSGLDINNERAVAAWTEAYNAVQSAEKYYIDANKAIEKMQEVASREATREAIGAEKALIMGYPEVYAKAKKVYESDGVSYDTYYEYHFATSMMYADKDEDGKSISGSKKQKVVDYINGLDIPAEQKDALWLDAGYAENGLDDAPWNGGSGSFTKSSSGKRSGGSRKSNSSSSSSSSSTFNPTLPGYTQLIKSSEIKKGTIAKMPDLPLPKVKTAEEIKKAKKKRASEYWKNKKDFFD